MRESFLDTAEQILRFKSHRDSLVRKMVITLIPTLAAYDTQTFSERYLHKSMSHLLTQLEKPNERSFGAPSLHRRLCHVYSLDDSLYCYRTHCHCGGERYETFPRLHYGSD